MSVTDMYSLTFNEGSRKMTGGIPPNSVSVMQADPSLGTFQKSQALSAEISLESRVEFLLAS